MRQEHNIPERRTAERGPVDLMEKFMAWIPSPAFPSHRPPESSGKPESGEDSGRSGGLGGGVGRGFLSIVPPASQGADGGFPGPDWFSGQPADNVRKPETFH